MKPIVGGNPIIIKAPTVIEKHVRGAIVANPSISETFFTLKFVAKIPALKNSTIFPNA